MRARVHLRGHIAGFPFGVKIRRRFIRGLAYPHHLVPRRHPRRDGTDVTFFPKVQRDRIAATATKKNMDRTDKFRTCAHDGTGSPPVQSLPLALTRGQGQA